MDPRALRSCVCGLIGLLFVAPRTALHLDALVHARLDTGAANASTARALRQASSGAAEPLACVFEPHAGFDGSALTWGMSFKTANAAECCEACQAHRRICASDDATSAVPFWKPSLASGGPARCRRRPIGCSVFVYCASAACVPYIEIHISQGPLRPRDPCSVFTRAGRSSSRTRRPDAALLGQRHSQPHLWRVRACAHGCAHVRARSAPAPACARVGALRRARGGCSRLRTCRHPRLRCWLKTQADPSRPRAPAYGAYPPAYRAKHRTAPPRVQWVSGALVPAGTTLRVDGPYWKYRRA